LPLRQRLEAVPETVQEFDLAAAQKNREGAALVAAGYNGAGIYLLGYSAEMLLKNAYFRYTGASWADRVGPRLGSALTAGRILIPLVPHEGYHSLRFWASLLRETLPAPPSAAAAGRALHLADPAAASELLDRCALSSRPGDRDGSGDRPG